MSGEGKSIGWGHYFDSPAHGDTWMVRGLNGYFASPNAYGLWRQSLLNNLTIAVLAGLDRGLYSEEVDALWDEAEARANDFLTSTREEQGDASEGKD